MLISDQEKLQQYFLECANEMLSSNGINAVESLAPEREGDEVVAAVIGFGGDLLRGTLTTLTPMKLLRDSYPARMPGVEPPDDDVVDWAGEFANQLLGRLKQKLLGHRVVLSLSTPKTMFAETFRLSQTVRGLRCALGFKAEGQQLGMWLDYLADSDQEWLGGPVDESGKAADEGDLLMF